MHPQIYEGQIWRPPSEAKSLILQVSIGCSWNACHFCISYKKKRFRVKSLEKIQQEINIAKKYYPRPQRIFLADGDALAIETDVLISILKLIHTNFPQVERIGLYAYARNALEKNFSELSSIHDAGINIAYLGLESGDDTVLHDMRKGVTNEENIEACFKLQKAGITLSIISILGLGGKSRWQENAKKTAESVCNINPKYFAPLTLMIPDGTPLAKRVHRSEFEPLTPHETLEELKLLVSGLDKLTNCVFRTNHASNYVTLGGILSRDQNLLINKIETLIATGTLKHELFRGL
ncbi:MAG: radical SAM protein [Promethearchaeota archaeon]